MYLIVVQGHTKGHIRTFWFIITFLESFQSNTMCQDYVYIKWEYWSTMQKIKHYTRDENKVNEKKNIIML